MSAIGFLVLLILAIALLMALIMKVKLHPTFSLFITALIMGVVMGFFEPEGFSIGEVLALINNGFGSTLGSMGIPIMLGAILAMGVQDTGAAKSIANFFIRLFRGKNLELAPRPDGVHRLHPRVRRHHHHSDLQHRQRPFQAETHLHG